MTVTVANDGSFDLNVSVVRIVGPGAARYSLPGLPMLPRVVAEGSVFDVVVGYDPTLESAGEGAANLEVLSNALGEPIDHRPLLASLKSFVTTQATPRAAAGRRRAASR